MSLGIILSRSRPRPFVYTVPRRNNNARRSRSASSYGSCAVTSLYANSKLKTLVKFLNLSRELFLYFILYTNCKLKVVVKSLDVKKYCIESLIKKCKVASMRSSTSMKQRYGVLP